MNSEPDTCRVLALLCELREAGFSFRLDESGCCRVSPGSRLSDVQRRVFLELRASLAERLRAEGSVEVMLRQEVGPLFAAYEAGTIPETYYRWENVNGGEQWECRNLREWTAIALNRARRVLLGDDDDEPVEVALLRLRLCSEAVVARALSDTDRRAKETPCIEACPDEAESP